MQPWFEMAPFPSGATMSFFNYAWCNLKPFTTTGGVVSRISGKYSRGRENRRSVIAAIAPNKIARTSGSFAEVFQDSRLRNCSILSVHRVPVEFQHGMAHCGDREWSVQDRGPAPAPQLLTLATV